MLWRMHLISQSFYYVTKERRYYTSSCYPPGLNDLTRVLWLLIFSAPLQMLRTWYKNETHSVKLPWTNVRPTAETSTYTIQQTQETNIPAPSGIRTRDPSYRAAADQLTKHCVTICGWLTTIISSRVVVLTFATLAALVSRSHSITFISNKASASAEWSFSTTNNPKSITYSSPKDWRYMLLSPS